MLHNTSTKAKINFIWVKHQKLGSGVQVKQQNVVFDGATLTAVDVLAAVVQP